MSLEFMNSRISIWRAFDSVWCLMTTLDIATSFLSFQCSILPYNWNLERSNAESMDGGGPPRGWRPTRWDNVCRAVPRGTTSSRILFHVWSWFLPARQYPAAVLWDSCVGI